MASLSAQKKTRLPLVLVAGGAGFLGSHVCEALLAQNCRVLCIDDLTTGSKDNITLLLKTPQFSFIESDINSGVLSKLEPVDFIVHLAGIESYLQEVKPNLETLLTNSMGVHFLLEKSLADKSQFLFVSSADIYFGVASHFSLNSYFGRTNEEESMYSHHEAKRFGEALVDEYHKKYHLDARIARIIDVYGPRMNLKSSFPLNHLFGAVVGGKPLTVYGEGLEEVYPTFISDVVYGLMRILFTKEASGGIYYLVNPKKMRTLDAARFLSRFTAPGQKIEFAPSEEIPLPSAEIDISRSRDDLRWEPKIDFQEGALQTLSWFKESKKHSDQHEERGVSGVSSVYEVAQEVPAVYREDEDKESFFKKIGYRIGRAAKIAKVVSFLSVKWTKEGVSYLGKSLKNNVSIAFSSRGKNSNKGIEQRREEAMACAVGRPISSKMMPSFPQSPATLSGKSYVRVGFIGVCILFIFLGLISPLLFTAVFSYRGMKALYAAQDNLGGFNFGAAENNLQTAEKSFSTASQGLEKLLWFSSLLHVRRETQSIAYLLTAAEDISNALYRASIGTAPLAKEINTLLSSDQTVESRLQAVIKASKVEYAFASDKLGEAQAQLKLVDKNSLPLIVQNRVVELEERLSFARQALFKLDSLNSLLPAISGFEEDRVYLFLFQNSHELRATGGFIGSYARLLIKEGKIVDLKVDDVYNPDGQLTQTIEPPSPLKQYLSVKSWGMRDGNWSPDFSVSAAKVKELYEKATGDRIDGIVAIDLYTIEEVLKTIGSVTIPSYNEEITADNLFKKTEYYAEVGFQPGSTGKKDFLGALSQELINNLRMLPFEKWSPLLQALLTATKERHILFYFEEPALSQLIDEQGIGGKVANAEGDYLWVVDSNIGGNKANYWVERSIDYSVEIDRDGRMKSVVTIGYTHRGVSESWPGGNYKNYLRVYVPKGSVLLGGSGFSSGIETAVELGKAVYGGLVEVPIKSRKEVTLSFYLPEEFDITEMHPTYSLYVQKQSGTQADALRLAFSWPQYLDPGAFFPNATADDQAGTVSTTLDVDRSFTIEFTPAR